MSVKSQVGLRNCLEKSQVCSHLARPSVGEVMLKEEIFTLAKQSPSLFVKTELNTNLSALYPALMPVCGTMDVGGLVPLPF